MHRLKILQFIGSTKWGGAEKVFVELANQLAKDCELYVVLINGTDFTDRFSPEIKCIITSSKGSRRNLFLLFELGRIIRNIQPDIVHTHASKATEMIYHIGKLLKLNQVATKHNARKGKIFNKISWVTTVSEQARTTIHNPGYVEIIYNGIIPKKIEQQVKKSPFSIITIGRLDAYKGFDILIKEVGKLSFDFVLNIVGEGKERINLEKLIRDLKLEEKVFLLGHRENVPELLGKSHLQVISSRTEGFSLAAVEGLYYSDMLLSRSVGIAAEILPAELLVHDFNFAAKIEGTHKNYDYFYKIFQNTKHTQRNRFLLTDISRKYVELYSRVLQNG